METVNEYGTFLHTAPLDSMSYETVCNPLIDDYVPSCSLGAGEMKSECHGEAPTGATLDHSKEPFDV